MSEKVCVLFILMTCVVGTAFAWKYDSKVTVTVADIEPHEFFECTGKPNSAFYSLEFVSYFTEAELRVIPHFGESVFFTRVPSLTIDLDSYGDERPTFDEVWFSRLNERQESLGLRYDWKSVESPWHFVVAAGGQKCDAKVFGPFDYTGYIRDKTRAYELGLGRYLGEGLYAKLGVASESIEWEWSYVSKPEWSRFVYEDNYKYEFDLKKLIPITESQLFSLGLFMIYEDVKSDSVYRFLFWEPGGSDFKVVGLVDYYVDWKTRVSLGKQFSDNEYGDSHSVSLRRDLWKGYYVEVEAEKGKGCPLSYLGIDTGYKGYLRDRHTYRFAIGTKF
ncbi:hypothetical protein VDG1235_3698 [Verrucomicrobiia bacterium DG1235]|nr:hypothetical protein VDG1235_3698 [Verrucomicrobiae bacterium DG1235]